MKKVNFLLVFFSFFGLAFTSSAQVRVAKNVNYNKGLESSYTLNIYYQKKSVYQVRGVKQDVIVFIHGGSWSTGKKETYWWLGRNLAKENVVAVIINYPLAPLATYSEMAAACAKAVKWVKDSIADYGGNSERIFVMGHSAGGHLAELINADPQYFKSERILNPIKGVILNDAFGLDMEEYLTKADKDHYYFDFIRTFGANSGVWQAGSPLYFINNVKNPHLILYGTKTYDAIRLQSGRMFQILQSKGVPVQLEIVDDKKHVGMISQMIWRGNKLYNLVFDFIKRCN